MDAIHFLDVRNGGPVAHATARIDAATALRKACLGVVAPIGRVCLPSIDRAHKANDWRAGEYPPELERQGIYTPPLLSFRSRFCAEQ